MDNICFWFEKCKEDHSLPYNLPADTCYKYPENFNQRCYIPYIKARIVRLTKRLQSKPPYSIAERARFRSIIEWCEDVIAFNERYKQGD